MNFFQAFIIAVVEGLTEFLPISSTAHMKFVSPLVGVDTEAPFSQMFEVVIQLAAILAVVVLYRKKFFDFSKKDFYFKIILAVIPSLIAGYLLKKHIDAALGSITFIAWVMVVGGIILLFIDKLFSHAMFDKEEAVDNRRAFVIGCGQVLAIIFPGLSRSAATIITGMAQKLTRNEAAEFSFFLAVPTMFAASAKSFMDTYTDHPEVLGTQNLLVLLFGSVVSFIVAMLAIKFFIGFLKKHGFFVWGVYRIIIGIVILILITLGLI
ncbi:MAG: Undecaprenyl-diphosphatase [Bacteroidota bacterium]|jgi:undecaprenyl-diphosphatase